MTYEDWCLRYKSLLAEAKIYNDWRRRAKHRLLTDIGPRIAKLGQTGYMGCGFHYGKEQTFGKLVTELALSWQPSANHCGKIEDDQLMAISVKVHVEFFIEEIVKAERSVVSSATLTKS